MLLVLGAVAGCHGQHLLSFDGWLIFDAPANPAALRQLDAGLVEIDFGQVPVGVTETIAVSYASLAGVIGLGAVTQLGDAGGFGLTLPSAPDTRQLEASFTPGAAGPQTALLQMAEDSALVPAVTFELTGEGIGAALLVEPNPIDFGLAHAGDTVTKSFTITNTATIPAPIVFSAIHGDDPDCFSISGASQGPLAPGASQQFSASFLAQLGSQDAFFDVTGWSGDPPVRVSLSGEGVAVCVTISPVVEFGDVPIGSTAAQSAVVLNLCNSQTFHLVAPAPSMIPPSLGFSLGPAQVSVPTPIPPGGSVAVPVTFGPSVPGPEAVGLTVASDDPEARQLLAYLDGFGIGEVQFISCVPRSLDFGSVPIGHSGTMPVACVNLGGSPFEIAQGGLRTGNSAFDASLLLPDGGLAGAGGSLSLAIGQTAHILVAFRPQDGGEYETELAISDGGLGTAGTTIPLGGSGIVPDSCKLQIIPSQLDFDEVPAGDTGVLQLEHSNLGDSLCAIDGVAIEPGSDGAFTLPGGPQGYVLLSYPGDSDNPASLPTSLRLAVSYAPTQNQLLATGTIDVTTANATRAQSFIPISGSSQQACLRIQPSLHDFGKLVFGPDHELCSPAVAGFVIRNTCATSVAVTRLAINSGVDSVAQFALESGLKLPLSLAPFGSAQFQVSFLPTTTGTKVGAVTVTSDENQLAPYLVSLEGDAEASVPQVDVFTMQSALNPLDMLWILDADDDRDQESVLAQLVPSLVNAMSQANIDFRMAVTTTDTCAADRSDQGAFEPCDHCLLWGDAGGPEFITPETRDAGAELVRLFDIPALQALPIFGICANINGDEHFFDSIAAALSADQLAGHNAGFLRENADLAVVLINGDAEDDAYGEIAPPEIGAHGPYLTSLQQVITLLAQLKPTSKASVFYVASGETVFGASQNIGKLVTATGGLEIDTTDPAAAWEPQFIGLFQYFESLGFFKLTRVPLNPSDIQVSVNGVVTDAWTYDSAQDGVLLQAGSLPPPGSQISITYSAAGCSIPVFPLPP